MTDAEMGAKGAEITNTSITDAGGEGAGMTDDGLKGAETKGDDNVIKTPLPVKTVDVSDDDGEDDKVLKVACTEWDAIAKDPTCIQEIEEFRRSKRLPKASTFLMSPYVAGKVRIPKYIPKKSLLSKEDHDFMYACIKGSRYMHLTCHTFLSAFNNMYFLLTHEFLFF